MIARLEARTGVPIADLEAMALAPRVKAPLLVLHDHDDREVPFEDGAEVADHWPGARLVATRGLGHRRILRAPAVITHVVEVVTGAPWTFRTGLDRFGLDRELFERERRAA
jgi:pimeloyl-ACP methyl ester carboxylesterase